MNLPSAQPDLSGYSDRLWRAAYERGKAEAQADIIHCGECQHWYINCLAVSDKHGCDKVGDYTKPDFYCGWAERKEGEVDALD